MPQTDLLAFVGAAPAYVLPGTRRPKGPVDWRRSPRCKRNSRSSFRKVSPESAIKLDYDISRSTLTQLVLEVPQDQKVVNVFDRNVKRWNVATEDGKQVIRVELFEATQGKQPLLVELEKFSDATQDRRTNVPAALVRAVGVGRQQGIVVARLEEGLQGEAVKRTGLLQLDQNDLPESLREPDLGVRLSLRCRPVRTDPARREGAAPHLGHGTDRCGTEYRSFDVELAGPVPDRRCRPVPVARRDSGRTLKSVQFREKRSAMPAGRSRLVSSRSGRRVRPGLSICPRKPSARLACRCNCNVRSATPIC